jgi:hypothetical protein
MTTNLLKETLRKLELHGKTVAYVQWVGSEKFGRFDFYEFSAVADREYYNGYGAQEVAFDLVVVGKDWWLERCEYDGAERWEFKTVPKRPSNFEVPTRVIGGMWCSLKEINDEGH